MQFLTGIKKIKLNLGTTFLLGVLLGSFIFLMIYGVDVVRFTNINWLTHSGDLEGIWDLTQHYMGWVFFRKTPWTFPFGLTEGITIEPISVAYTDSIPLFAIFFKLLSPLLPENFQYFGFFELLSYGLMGGFGAIIPYKYSKSVYFNMISASFFVLSPVLLKRTLYHTALSAHFVILAAICLWIYRSDFKKRKKYITIWAILCAVATLINPYYTPMVVGIMLCSQLQDLIVRKNIKECVLQIGICGVITIIAGYSIGLFYGSVSASAESLELLSTNLNSLFNPHDVHVDIPRAYTFNFKDYSSSLFFSGFPYGVGWQEEGFAYLGLGMIILLVASLILFARQLLGRKSTNRIVHNDNREVVRTRKSYGISIFIGLMVFMFLALGPVCYFNEHVLYTISWPDKIYNMLSVFRSTGRFVWPVHFGVMTLVILAIAKSAKEERRGLLLMVVCLVIQIIDLWPAYTNKHSIYANVRYDSSSDFEGYMLEDPAWDYLAENCDEIIFYIPTGATICMSPEMSCSFELLADKYDLSLNATYCSRPVDQAADEYAKNEMMYREEGKRDSGQIFVFLDETRIPDCEKAGLSLYQIDDIWIGTELTIENK